MEDQIEVGGNEHSSNDYAQVTGGNKLEILKFGRRGPVRATSIWLSDDLKALTYFSKTLGPKFGSRRTSTCQL